MKLCKTTQSMDRHILIEHNFINLVFNNSYQIFTFFMDLLQPKDTQNKVFHVHYSKTNHPTRSKSLIFYYYMQNTFPFPHLALMNSLLVMDNLRKQTITYHISSSHNKKHTPNPKTTFTLTQYIHFFTHYHCKFHCHHTCSHKRILNSCY